MEISKTHSKESADRNFGDEEEGLGFLSETQRKQRIEDGRATCKLVVFLSVISFLALLVILFNSPELHKLTGLKNLRENNSSEPGGHLDFRPCPASKYYGQDMPAPRRCWDFNMYFFEGQESLTAVAGGISRRLGAHYGLNGVDSARRKVASGPEPRVFATHVHWSTVDHVFGNPTKKTFKWAIMSDPASRCMEELFKSLNKMKPSDDEILSFANSSRCENIQKKYYMVEEGDDTARRYDFVGLAERFEESLIVLGHLLGLSAGDLLFAAPNVNFPLFGKPRSPLTIKREDWTDSLSQAVNKFLEGEFRNQNDKEYRLYQNLNTKLDSYIELIGRAKFEKALGSLKQHISTLGSECKVFSPDGSLLPSTKCYWESHGCGYECLNSYSTRSGIWTSLLE